MEDVRETKTGAVKCQRVKEFSLPPSLMHKHEGLARKIHCEQQLSGMHKQYMSMYACIEADTQNVWL